MDLMTKNLKKFLVEKKIYIVWIKNYIYPYDSMKDVQATLEDSTQPS